MLVRSSINKTDVNNTESTQVYCYSVLLRMLIGKPDLPEPSCLRQAGLAA